MQRTQQIMEENSMKNGRNNRVGMASKCSLRRSGSFWPVSYVCINANAGTGETQAAKEDGVLRATLDNGLRVVIVRNTLAPVVTTMVNYLVGSNEAPKGFRAWPMRKNT